MLNNLVKLQYFKTRYDQVNTTNTQAFNFAKTNQAHYPVSLYK